MWAGHTIQLAGRRGVLLQLTAETSCATQILVFTRIPSRYAVFRSSIYQSFVEKPQDDRAFCLLIQSRLLAAVHAESALAREIWKADLSCWLPVLPNATLSPLTPQDGDVYYHSWFWWQCRDLFSFLSFGVLQGSCWEQQTSSSIRTDQNPPWRDILGVETISFKGKLTRKTVSERHCWFQSCREQLSGVNMIPRKQPHKLPKGKRSPCSPCTCLIVQSLALMCLLPPYLWTNPGSSRTISPPPAAGQSHCACSMHPHVTAQGWCPPACSQGSVGATEHFPDVIWMGWEFTHISVNSAPSPGPSIMNAALFSWFVSIPKEHFEVNFCHFFKTCTKRYGFTAANNYRSILFFNNVKILLPLSRENGSPLIE